MSDLSHYFLSFSDASSSDALAPGCVGCRSNKQSSRLFMSCACCVLGVVLGLAAREDAGNSSSSSHADTHLLLGVSANACGCCCPEASWLAWASQSTLTPHTRRCVRRCATLPEGLCGSALACCVLRVAVRASLRLHHKGLRRVLFSKNNTTRRPQTAKDKPRHGQTGRRTNIN